MRTNLSLVQPLAWADTSGHVYASAQEARYGQIKRDLDALEARAVKALHAVMVEMRDFIIKKARSRATSMSNIVRSLEFSGRVKADLRRAIRQFMGRAWDAGSRDALREVRASKASVRAHGFNPDEPRDTRGRWAEWSETAVPHPAGTHLLAGDRKVAAQAFDLHRGDKKLGHVRNGIEGSGGQSAIKGDTRSTNANRVVRWQATVFDARLPGGSKTSFGHRSKRAAIEHVQSMAQLRNLSQDTRVYDAEPFTPRAALKWLDDKSFWISGVTGDQALASAKAVIMQGIKTGKSNKEMIDGIAGVFEPWIGKAPGVEAEVVDPYRLETIVRTNGTDAYNHGRLTEMTDPDVADGLIGIRYSAIMDERTTQVCLFLDGKVFHPGDVDLEELVPPNHYNCRSIIVPVVAGETMDESEFITDDEVGRAKALADAKFLALRGLWINYQEE